MEATAEASAEATSVAIPEVAWEETWHTLPDRPRPIVTKILFFGNRAFDSGTLKSKLATRGDSFWGRSVIFSFGGHRRASKDWKLKDIGLLTSFYRSRGFLDAAVSESFYHDTSANELWVKIDVGEGKPTFFGLVSFGGDVSEFSSPLAKAASDLTSDSTFNQYLLETVLFRIKEIYANNGYPFARVFLDTLRTEGNPKLPLSFRIEKEGLVHFGEVEIAGVTRTNPKVVRRELAFKPGDLYSRKKIIKTQQQVYASGLFNFVSLSVKPKADSAGKKIDTLDRRPDFLLKVVERRPSAVNLHVGAGQFKQEIVRKEEQQDLTFDLAGGWENRNLGGSGRRLSFSASTAFLVVTENRLLSNKFSADYTEPWLLSTRTYGNLSASFEPAVRDRFGTFRIQTATQALTFLYPVSLTHRFTFGLSLQEINIFGLSPAQVDSLKLARGLNVRRRLSVSWEKDTRGNLLLSTAGSFTRFEGELLGGPLGGDAHFAKFIFNWNRYQTLAGNNILATRFRYGQAILVGRKGNLPSIDAFFLGGANSLRGYAENSIGPTFIENNQKRPVGGKSLFLATLEIRRPLFWRFWGNLFSDFGNIFQASREIVPDNILVSVGAGVQFITLIGPLRVEYGKRVIHGTEPPGQRVHFSILFAF